MIVLVSVVLGGTVVGDWRFDSLGGGHLQSRVNGVCEPREMVMPTITLLYIIN